MDGGIVGGAWICVIWALVEGIGLVGMLFELFIVESSEFDVSSITSNVGQDGDGDWEG